MDQGRPAVIHHHYHHRSGGGYLAAFLAFTIAGTIVWTIEHAWPFLLAALGIYTLAMIIKDAKKATKPIALPALDAAKLSDEQNRTVRMTDAEREQVAQTLRAAGTDGRLDLDELEQRVAKAYGAKTWADVTPLLEDLAVSV